MKLCFSKLNSTGMKYFFLANVGTMLTLGRVFIPENEKRSNCNPTKRLWQFQPLKCGAKYKDLLTFGVVASGRMSASEVAVWICDVSTLLVPP
jgi:hypothetical protein